MWSLKNINLMTATRMVRQSLLQQDRIVNSPQVKNFNALGVTKIAQVSPKQIKSAHNEFLALIKLLNRSSLISSPTTRHLSTSIQLFEKESDKNKSKEQDQAKTSDNSNNNNQKDAEKSSDGKKPDEKQKKKSKKKVPNPEDFNHWNRLIAFITNSVLWTALIYGIGFALFIVVSIISGNNEYQNSERTVVSWKEFVQYMLAAGEVKELVVRPQYDYVKIVLHDGAIINGRRTRLPMYFLQIPNADRFEQRLRELEKRMGIKESIPIRYERINEAYGKLFAAAVLIAIIALIMKNTKVKMGNMSSGFSMGKAKVTVIENGKGKGVYFKDVAGLKEAKQEVIEFVDYLKRPERYQKLGARVPKGALLLGPPGCGKTLLAKAVATEAGVPFLTMNGSEFIEMIGGLGAARVRDLFKKAKKKAPCIIYIDEIDAIGRQRSNTSTPTSGESEQTLNQLLVELDGMASKEGILMLASTNRADVLDNALLRPGRFDRHIEIDLPSLEERIEIFEKHLSRVTLEKSPSEYSRRLAYLSPGFSGADIANVCNEAALHAARFSQKCVTAKDLEYAIERSVGGTEKRSNSLNEEERRTVAYHESGHALVGWLLENSDVLQKVTIVPRTNLALGFAQYTPHDQKLFTKEQLIDKIRMALGGRAAENITFQRITTGAQNDLEKVTKIAFSMVAKYGMSETLGPMYVPDEPIQQHPLVAEKPFSNALNNIIDLESRKIITDAYFQAENILKTNRDKLVTLAEALLKQETLNYDQVVELIGPPKYESAKRKIDPVEFEQSLNSLSSSEDSVDSQNTANAK